MSSLKVRLRNGESVVGTMICVVGNPDIIKIMQASGFDFVVIDNEHGCFDYGVAAGMIGLARALDFPCLVRIPNAGREGILKYMEMGASGFLLPNCDTAEQAKALVEHSKYAPLGNRGVSMLRAHTGYEKVASPVEYMKRANDDGVLLCQIESSRGVGNIDSILAVDGVDAAFIGPNDLSQSYGLMGQYDHPTVAGAIDRVMEAAKRAGKHSGIHMVGPTASLKEWMRKGMTVNLWSNEVALMQQAAREGLSQLR